MEQCLENPDSIHGHVLHYEEGELILKECWVRDYKDDRYLCELLDGCMKWVKRSHFKDSI